MLKVNEEKILARYNAIDIELKSYKEKATAIVNQIPDVSEDGKVQIIEILVNEKLGKLIEEKKVLDLYVEDVSEVVEEVNPF